MLVVKFSATMKYLYVFLHSGIKFIPVFFRRCLFVKFNPKMGLIPRWNHPCLQWKVSHCLHFLNNIKFYENRKKRRINTSSWNRILEWQCFYLIFATYVLNMLSNFNMFEHSASQQEYFIGTFHKKWGLENHYNLFSL